MTSEASRVQPVCEAAKPTADGTERKNDQTDVHTRTRGGKTNEIDEKRQSKHQRIMEKKI
jgi:hypothetical protein